jgi:phosphopantetheinyl transferase (holo-ACP synthase)
MPLFYQHTINGNTKLGVWRIEEAEDFFLEKVPLKRDVFHPFKRLQHLAGRYLLPVLYEDFPLEEIIIADTRKPFLENEKYHFSISHCGEYAAAIVSLKSRVGVDVEFVTPRIQHISKKFLGEKEQHFFNEDYQGFLDQWGLKEKIYIEFLTLIWSAKEAIYKWNGRGQVDFKEHIQLYGAITFHENDWMELPFIFSKEYPIPLTVYAKIFEGVVLAWVAT